MTKYISPAGLEKLKKELDFLKNEKRKELAETLKKAIAHGDLSENFEYSEAREAQGFLEGRILELEELIKNSKIVSENPKTAWIQVGSVFVAKCEDEEQRFEIVGVEESDPLQGKISVESPLGKAFLNKSEGAIVAVDTPQGEVKYKILKVE
ncbi:MAG: transcription elongation factor GreA [Patescibacteria group bacterium]|nr:transcription elongation factor GreA [Patescibacteria group bacterium]